MNNLLGISSKIAYDVDSSQHKHHLQRKCSLLYIDSFLCNLMNINAYI